MRIIDVGMYDGSDTRYYLESGHEVLAIEANPALCAAVSESLDRYVRAGKLKILNVAVSNSPGEVELAISGQDLGSSSIIAERIANRFPLGSYRVPARRFADILIEHPADFIKIDVEGADGECVRALTAQTAPRYLSFEASEDISPELRHLHDVGFTQFKFIQQTSFRSLDRQNLLMDRFVRKAFHVLGYMEPQYVRRNGRFFKLMHSAGPAPWDSDGGWLSLQDALRQWDRGQKWTWYDVHATR